MSDYSETQNIVRQVIPFLSKKEIPLTPTNYRLWFEYFLGKKEEVKTRLDELLRSDAVFSDELSEKLYQEFFVRDLQAESSEKARAEIDLAENLSAKVNEMVVSAMKDVLAGLNTSSGYGDKLQKYQTTIEKVTGIDSVKSLLTDMIRDTQEATMENTRIHKKLERSSNELEILQTSLKEARIEARTDKLTKLWNRRYFDEAVSNFLEAQKNGQTFSLILLDIDFFKKFNDTYGHLIGDKLLKHIASEITRLAPKGGHVCRYGGEEFGIILSEAGVSKATQFAETVRNEIKNVDFTIRGARVEVTVSCGVAKAVPTDSPKSLVERADAALYLAKKGGRDNVKTESDLKAGA